MKIHHSSPLACLLVCALFTCGCSEKTTDDGSSEKVEFVNIGTGGMTGVYYPTGGHIAELVNKKQDVYGIKCSHESTLGSVFNIKSVLAGDMVFGIAQSDRQYQAVNGLAEWEADGPQTDLRAVFSIHSETVNLIASVDSGIESITDLKGKRVNIGNPGSGQRQNSIDALENAGIDCETEIQAEEVKAADAPDLLKDGRIDAFFYTVGHPAATLKEASAGKRKVRVVPIDDIQGLLDDFPYYAPAEIDMKHYPTAANASDGKVKSFAVKATFICSAKTSDNIVYAITKEVFENLDDFKELHPAYADLTPEGMLLGLSAPIHPGALKYFKEAGLK